MGTHGTADEQIDEFKVRRLVELTIMYHADKREVGGPVDEIELDANKVSLGSGRKMAM